MSGTRRRPARTSQSWTAHAVRWIAFSVAITAPRSVAIAEPRAPAPSASTQAATAQTAETPQVIDGDILRDYDYAFEISRPTQEWSHWTEAEVRKINPEAIAGVLSYAGEGFVMIAAEPLPGQTLDHYVDQVLRRVTAQLGSVESLERIAIDGEPAVELKIAGVRQQIAFTYLMRLVLHRGFGYQISAWTLSARFAQHEAMLRRAADSFRFLPRRWPRHRAAAYRKDEQGVDWRVRGDRYENASFGLEMTLPDGWRFGTSAELAQADAATCLILAHAQPFIEQSYLVEPIGDLDRLEYTRRRRRAFETRLRLEKPDETVDLVIAGEPAVHAIYRKTLDTGLEVDRVHTVFYHGSFCVQVDTRWRSVESEEAGRAFEAPLRHLGFLTEHETAVLAEELRAEDMDNAVGPGFCMRGGVYRDFSYGFCLRKPEGLWEAHTSQAAAGITPDSVLVLIQPARGIYMAVIPEYLGHLAHRQYHQILLDNMGAPEDTAVQPVRSEGATMRVSRFEMQLQDDGPLFKYALVTAVRGERGVQILIWGLAANMNDVEELVSELATLLDIPEEPPAEVVEERTLYRDLRLGYQISVPDEEWQLKPESIENLQPLSSSVVLRRGTTTCTFMALCVRGASEDLIAESMIQASGLTNFKQTSRQESDDSLGGLSARHVTLSGRRGVSSASMDMWIAQRGNTLYGVLVHNARGFLARTLGASAEECKRCFSLLD